MLGEEGGGRVEEGEDLPVEDLPVPARDRELTLEKTAVIQGSQMSLLGQCRHRQFVLIN